LELETKSLAHTSDMGGKALVNKTSIRSEKMKKEADKARPGQGPYENSQDNLKITRRERDLRLLSLGEAAEDP